MNAVLSVPDATQAFLKKVGLGSLTEIRYKPAKIVTDYGLPHKPRDYDVVVLHHQLLPSKLARHPAIKNVPILELVFDRRQIIADIYLLDAGGIHVQIQEGEYLSGVNERPPCKQARFFFNGVDLGWFMRK